MEGKFDVKLEGNVLKVHLSGSLDATNSPALSDQLKQMQGRDINEIVFFADKLDYMASAGLRVIIFSIQKLIPQGGKAYFIGGTDDVLSVLSMTGLDDSLIIQDTYEE